MNRNPSSLRSTPTKYSPLFKADKTTNYIYEELTIKEQTIGKSNDFSDPKTVQELKKMKNRKKVHKFCFIILGSLLEITDPCTCSNCF